MSPPVQARLRSISLAVADFDSIGEERLAATLSALRRRAATEALEEIERWRQSLWDDCISYDGAQYDLSCWVRDECRLHVQGGRFEQAIALIERYRRQPAYAFKESP